jgi:hypothetical protein
VSEGKSISPVTESAKYLFLFLCGGSSSTVSGERVIDNKNPPTQSGVCVHQVCVHQVYTRI